MQDRGKTRGGAHAADTAQAATGSMPLAQLYCQSRSALILVSRSSDRGPPSMPSKRLVYSSTARLGSRQPASTLSRLAWQAALPARRVRRGGNLSNQLVPMQVVLREATCAAADAHPALLRCHSHTKPLAGKGW